MLITILTGVVSYYAGLYTYLWYQLYTPQRKIKDNVNLDNNLKYKQL